MENTQDKQQDSGLPSRPVIGATARNEETRSHLVQVHCYACDYHGYGDPDDACYFCGQYDLQEFDRDEEDPNLLPAWL